MLILHTGDLHLTEGPRFADTMRCLEHVVAVGQERGVALWLVGGDLTGTTVPHVATVAERNGIAAILQDMTVQAPVVVIQENHDAPGDLDIYALIGVDYPIHIVARPQVIPIGGALVFCMPYPSK